MVSRTLAGVAFVALLLTACAHRAGAPAPGAPEPGTVRRLDVDYRHQPRVVGGPSASVVASAPARGGAHTAASPRLPDPPLVRAADAGMNPEALDSLDRFIRRGLADGVAPGAALVIGRHGRLVRLRGYGRLDWPMASEPVTDSTLYDLASLTKVVGTTTAAMILYDEGKLDLDARVSRYLPGWQGDSAKMTVTVRNLLTHTAGLPAYLPLWHDLRGKQAYYRRIESIALSYPPGTKTVYSDLGMILTQAIVERITHQPINRFLRARVFGPLGMTDTYYSPIQVAGGVGPMGYGPPGSAFSHRVGPSSYEGLAMSGPGDEHPDPPPAPPLDLSPWLKALVRRTAPTEIDPTGTLIHGYVHDENARAMGGVAGHAGLFSSARDLAIFVQMLMNDGVYRGHRIVKASTVRLFTRRQNPASTRALGWDTPGPGSSAGEYFTCSSFGHTGFTGTSIWADPRHDVFVVLLMNRVDPTRDNEKHIAFRRAVDSRIEQAITDMSVRAEACSP